MPQGTPRTLGTPVPQGPRWSEYSSPPPLPPFPSPPSFIPGWCPLPGGPGRIRSSWLAGAAVLVVVGSAPTPTAAGRPLRQSVSALRFPAVAAALPTL